VTNFPEILSGRVKTLHPKIYGGLLSLREDADHMRQIAEQDIDLIDLVVVNLYPFETTVANTDATVEQAVENIDIGGPCMIRAAAKNYRDITIVTDPSQYSTLITELQSNDGETTPETRRVFALAAFSRTTAYDASISQYFARQFDQASQFPERLVLSFEKIQNLRYGENPHQKAAFYRQAGFAEHGIAGYKQLHGKELSFNNIIDLDGAVAAVRDFDEPAVAIIKHTNPCGVATADSCHAAYKKALATDPVSAFGGIVSLNREVDPDTAKAIRDVFTEVVVAPAFSSQALDILTVKKNIRLMRAETLQTVNEKEPDIKHVAGGILLQDQDLLKLSDINFKVVSKRQPTEQEWTALRFGWRVVKCVKSNAIVYCLADRTIGIGAGQMSRVDASKFAVDKARRMNLELKDTVLASDAFFPFRDGVDEAANAGATAVIQPGGSVRDDEVIAAADENNMAMVFTGVRHFRH
jgi:phosphoribosylaminoimidazolecarboxamide formyltransferase/IMP cyclohydrolase